MRLEANYEDCKDRSPKPVWFLPVLLKIPAVQLIAPTVLATPTFCSNICARLDKTKCHICCWFFRIRNCCTQCLWEWSKTIDRCCEKRIVNKLLQVLWELSENAPPACSCLPSPCSPSLPAQHWCKVGKSQANDGNSFAKGTASSLPLDPLFLFSVISTTFSQGKFSQKILQVCHLSDTSTVWVCRSWIVFYRCQKWNQRPSESTLGFVQASQQRRTASHQGLQHWIGGLNKKGKIVIAILEGVHWRFQDAEGGF